MKPTYIERFTFNTIFGLDEQRDYMLRKVQQSKAGSSRFYPVFVPRPAVAVAEPERRE